MSTLVKQADRQGSRDQFLLNNCPNSLALGNCNWHSGAMKYGRLVRVSLSQTKGYMTYVVAEEDATKAVAMVRTLVGPAPYVELSLIHI